MNLIQDKNPGAYAVNVPCLICCKMLRLADAWIDTEGPAFQAYYHAKCLPNKTTEQPKEQL